MYIPQLSDGCVTSSYSQYSVDCAFGHAAEQSTPLDHSVAGLWCTSFGLGWLGVGFAGDFESEMREGEMLLLCISL